MRKQQQIWLEEHEKVRTLPAMASKRPHGSVLRFLEIIQGQLVAGAPRQAVDIGCGKGRNTVYLAEQGFDVYAMDYIDIALDLTKERAIAKNVSDKVRTSLTPIDQTWPFTDDFFDIAVDCFASIDIETKEGREMYKSEMFRTLKPGGFTLVVVVSAKDEMEAELARVSPGSEKNSTIWPETEKFQKNYADEELRQFYHEFEVLSLEVKQQPAFKLGKSYTATDIWLTLRKPS